MSILIAMAGGLAAGVGHVLAGPDHLAAVAPLAADGRRHRWRVGLLWGLGHSGGVWLLAILALLFREALPIETLSAWGERLVGFVLIGIGLWGLRQMLALRIHTHEHEHDGEAHVHIHAHSGPIEHDHADQHAADPGHSHAALGIGALHGVAGTAHLLGVLPALLLPDRASALGYVLAYGVGAIAAMSAFAWLVGLAGARLARGTAGYRAFLGTTCVAAIVVGFWWLGAGH